MKVFIESLKTPAGSLQIAATENAVIAVCFGKSLSSTLAQIERHAGESIELTGTSNHITHFAAEELRVYFSGKLATFTSPLKTFGTPFQKKTWKALLKVPYGKTISYGDQAQMVGNPKASRAIGSANGKNPICIMIPCHRIIAGDRTIGGYTGGLGIKKKLLALEGQLPASVRE